MNRKKQDRLSVMIKEKKKAQMTIYMTLVFSILIPLMFTIIEGARINASKLQLECVLEMGMDSVLAEYHRELFDQYGLLFIDTAYGSGTGSLENTKDHLLTYMAYNLKPQKGLLMIGNRDFYRLQTDSLEFIKSSRATDQDGEVFEKMVMSYMLQKYGISYIQDISKIIQVAESNHIFDRNILEENDCAQAKINAIELPESEEGKDWQEVVIENPTEGINRFRSQGLLPIVCSKPISGRTINPDLYASHRNLVEGNGVWEKWQESNSLEELLLLNEYFMLKTGNYRNGKDNSVLQYQTEYLIAGKANDTDNLKTVVNRLLLIRGGANSVYFASDETMKAEAETAAAALSCVLLMPELQEVFQAAIIAGWIYAESVNDLKLLLDGYKVPLIKKKGEWNLSLDQSMNISATAIGNSLNKESGLDYEDYLRLLLYTTAGKTKTFRMMDIIEMDIRKTNGSQNFCMDNCIAAFLLQVIFTSDYGYYFLMKRENGYY